MEDISTQSSTINFFKQKFQNFIDETLLEEISKKFYNFPYEKRLYKIDQHTSIEIHLLVLLYFTNAYNQAYLISKERETNKDEAYIEGLKKGYHRKREKLKEFKALCKNEDNPKSVRYESYLKRLLMIMAQSKKFSRTASLVPAILFMNKTLIDEMLKNLDKGSGSKELSLKQLVDNASDYFSFTYIATSKIINSFYIVVFTRLKLLGINEGDAFKFAKFIATRLFLKDIANDYRKSFITEKDIYLAGIYNKIPIFQWYMPSTKNRNKPYYPLEELNRIKKILSKAQKSLGIFQFFFQNWLLGMYPKERRKAILKVADNDVLTNVLTGDNLKNYIEKMYIAYAEMPFEVSRVIPKHIPLWKRIFSRIFWKIIAYFLLKPTK